MELKKAILFMAISALSFSIMSSLVKELQYFGVYELVFFRSLGTFFFTFGFLVYTKTPILGKKRKLLLIRAIAGVMSIILFFKSLEHLPVGSAVSIRYLAPVFTGIFAIVLLSERVKKRQWLYFIIAFCGALIIKNADAAMNEIGFLYALSSAVFSGFVFVIIRKIGKDENPVVIVNYFMMLALIVGGILAIPRWRIPIGAEWLLLFSIGIIGLFGQLFMTKAFQIAAANKIAPVKYLEVIFTVIIGSFWFGEVYTIWSVLGIILIIGGLSLNLLVNSKK